MPMNGHSLESGQVSEGSRLLGLHFQSICSSRCRSTVSLPSWNILTYRATVSYDNAASPGASRKSLKTISPIFEAADSSAVNVFLLSWYDLSILSRPISSAYANN